MIEVSVVLPFYNSEKYIGSSIESILNQTYKNFEIIAIDDFSNDKSYEIVQGLANKDSRIRLYTNEKKGLVKALNMGVYLSQGKYIARMDHDDLARPTRLAVQKKYLDDNSHIDACGSSIESFRGSKKRVWRSVRGEREIRVFSLFDSPLFHPTLFVKSEVLKCNPYCQDHEYVEDYELWQRLLLKGYLITNLEDVLLEYRLHDKQISSEEKDVMLAGLIRAQSKYFSSTAKVEVPKLLKLYLLSSKYKKKNIEDFPSIRYLVKELISLSSLNSFYCKDTLRAELKKRVLRWVISLPNGIVRSSYLVRHFSCDLKFHFSDYIYLIIKKIIKK